MTRIAEAVATWITDTILDQDNPEVDTPQIEEWGSSPIIQDAWITMTAAAGPNSNYYKTDAEYRDWLEFVADMRIDNDNDREPAEITDSEREAVIRELFAHENLWWYVASGTRTVNGERVQYVAFAPEDENTAIVLVTTEDGTQEVALTEVN